MKVSYNWLREYAPTTLTPLQLGEKFQMTSSVLDTLEDWSSKLENVVVGEVTEVKPHPDATKLRVATVKIGSKKRTIVCGAPNLALGQKVVVAQPGALLHPVKGERFEIQEATLRGVRSEGMLCGYDEIGIDLPSEGIIVLPAETRSGILAAQALMLEDSVLDLEVTPNRPDLLSYVGLAREAAAFDHRRLAEPPLATLEAVGGRRQGSAPHILPLEPAACLRYSAVQLSGIKVGQSPYWLQIRLLLSGIRPINNVVDVTNYVMLELGQPLHAFDAATLPKKGDRLQIGVRTLTKKEKLRTIDHTDRALEPGDVVIVDGNDRPIALAGVMGGAETEVSELTESILLESAVFHGPQIRRTSRRLGLRSEASSRFEKGLDPELTITALKRAIYLLKQVCGASVSGTLADNYPRHAERAKIHVTYAWVQQMLGVSISPAECKAILQKLGFQLSSLTKSSFEATPPSWRSDVRLPEDIIEELVRMWGYDRLPSTMPVGNVFPPRPNPEFELKKRLRHGLAACGYNECVSQGLVSAAAITRSGLDATNARRVRLPLSSEGEYLTPDHLVTFLQNVSGPNRAVTELSLLEIGKVFDAKRETLRASMLRRTDRDAETLYRETKSHLEHVLPAPLSYVPTKAESFYQEGSMLEIQANGTTIGSMGLLDGAIVANWKVRSGTTMLYVSLYLEPLTELSQGVRAYRPLPTQPEISRDLTLSVPEELPAGKVASFMEKEAAPILESYALGTIYRGTPGRKSITLNLVYRAANRTLADAEVNADIERLTALAIKRFA